MNRPTSLQLLFFVAIAFSLISTTTAPADTVFIDDFEDGNVTDGMPVTWTPGVGDNLAVEDGKLVVSALGYGQATVVAENLTDTSLRTKIKIREGEFVGVAIRYNPNLPPGFRSTNVAAWCNGDFNADGAVDGQDFILWNANKFTSSDGVSAVPEPGAGLLTFLGFTLLGFTATRR